MTHAKELIDGAIAAATEALVGPGDWLAGDQRRDGWIQVRDARTNELDRARSGAISPNAVAGGHEASSTLPAEAVEVLHRITSDPGRLTRAWADDLIATLGDTTYTELVGVAACAATVDMLSWAMTDCVPAIGPVAGGKPAQVRPGDVGDVGAWVAQTTGDTMANVSRSLSLVPQTNRIWVGLVQALYSRGSEFLDLRWQRALMRPQVELVAARTTAELECFY